MLRMIEKLKTFFTKTEEDNWHILWIDTMSAIKDFKIDSTQSTDIFNINPDEYTRDIECDIDFTMILTTIHQLRKEKSHPVTVEKTVGSLPKTLDHLYGHINLFLEHDNNLSRKEQYQHAIDYINRLGEECDIPLRNNN